MLEKIEILKTEERNYLLSRPNSPEPCGKQQPKIPVSNPPSVWNEANASPALKHPTPSRLLNTISEIARAVQTQPSPQPSNNNHYATDLIRFLSPQLDTHKFTKSSKASFGELAQKSRSSFKSNHAEEIQPSDSCSMSPPLRVNKVLRGENNTSKKVEIRVPSIQELSLVAQPRVDAQSAAKAAMPDLKYSIRRASSDVSATNISVKPDHGVSDARKVSENLNSQNFFLPDQAFNAIKKNELERPNF